MLATIFGPQILAVFRLIYNDMSKGTRWSQIAKNIIWLPIAPIRIYLETFRLKYLEMKLKISPADETLNEKYETKKRMFNLHVKLELGLETIYQLAGQSILLILSYPSHVYNHVFCPFTWIVQPSETSPRRTNSMGYWSA